MFADVGGELAHLECLGDVLMAGTCRERRRRPLLIKHFRLRLRVVLHHHGLRLIKIFERPICAAHDSAIVKLVALVLHHVHQLLLGQSIVDLAARLIRVVEDLGRLPQLLRGLALARGRVVLACRVWHARVQLSQVLHADSVL